MHCTERRAEDNDQNGMFVRSHGFLRIESGGSSAPRQILFEVSVGNFRPDGTRHIPSHKIRPVVIEYFLVVLSKRTISFQKGANFSHRTDILRVAASRPITSYSPFLLNQKSEVTRHGYYVLQLVKLIYMTFIIRTTHDLTAAINYAKDEMTGILTVCKGNVLG